MGQGSKFTSPETRVTFHHSAFHDLKNNGLITVSPGQRNLPAEGAVNCLTKKNMNGIQNTFAKQARTFVCQLVSFA
jgi:hypothetical protein